MPYKRSTRNGKWRKSFRGLEIRGAVLAFWNLNSRGVEEEVRI